jgi:hypothetical protein
MPGRRIKQWAARGSDWRSVAKRPAKLCSGRSLSSPSTLSHDRAVNLIEDRFDLAVRMSGGLDSNLVTRWLSALPVRGARRARLHRTPRPAAGAGQPGPAQLPDLFEFRQGDWRGAHWLSHVIERRRGELRFGVFPFQVVRGASVEARTGAGAGRRAGIVLRG